MIEDIECVTANIKSVGSGRVRVNYITLFYKDGSKVYPKSNNSLKRLISIFNQEQGYKDIQNLIWSAYPKLQGIRLELNGFDLTQNGVVTDDSWLKNDLDFLD